jgi:hypothetical protein
MKSSATCTIHLEDGTQITHINVIYSRWERGYSTFVVQRYDPADESRLQTFVYKRKNIKNTVREQEYSEDIDLTDKPKEQPGLDDENPQSVKIEDRGSFGSAKFYIVHGDHPELAYSGSRWVPHIGGHQTTALQVRNFGHRKEAEAYVKVCFPGATVK